MSKTRATVDFITEGDESGAVLHAYGEARERWNGNRVPVATQAQLALYLENVARGDLDSEEITLDTSPDGGLLYANRYGEENGEGDVWHRVGTLANGADLYALDGWCWIYASEGRL